MAIARRNVVDDLSGDQDLTAGDFLQARDHAQSRGLAAARGADQHDELLVGDVEVDAFHRLYAAVIFLDDSTARDFSHFGSFPQSGYREISVSSLRR
jgi:hypothetical protein